MKKFLAITPGDPAGIGPEVVWKAIKKNHEDWSNQPLLCVGAKKPFTRLRAEIIPASLDHLIPPKRKKPFIWLLEAPTKTEAVDTLLEGFQAGWSIDAATHLVQSGVCSALVTGPIHKERLQKGGYPFTGHTDFLANRCGGRSVTMMLANSELRISLVTVHIGIKDVPTRLTQDSIIRAVDQTVDGLRNWWGIKNPKIAVCALNPHAGEEGLFGSEEKTVIEPALKILRDRFKSSVELSGPHPSDTFFAKHVATPKKKRHDAVICMYHDQGLIPVKILDFPRTVNITLGLPMIRTSVDHGTGFDIAWKNRADPSSFISAVELARSMVRVQEKRKRR